MPDNRINIQINQPGIVGNETVDKNGWPTPLTDPSSELKVKVTNGSNGEQRNIRAMATDGQEKLSLTEGHGRFAMPQTDGNVYGDQNAPTGISVARNQAEPFETSANLRGQLSKPEGGSGSQNNI